MLLLFLRHCTFNYRIFQIKIKSMIMEKVPSLYNLLFLVLIHFSCESSSVVKTGLDRVIEFQELYQGKRIGIVTNHTAYNSKNEYITDIFQKSPNTGVVALFGPEHGIKGNEAAGTKIEDEVDTLKKIPIFSLYGKIRKPTPKMLKNIDILIFDIQDIGARFYTYIYTMSLAMEAAAENRIPFVVLDRPNPINGIDTEGNILEESFRSFIGLHPIPVRHGMTIGELARMFNEEGWLQNQIQADLKVISMKHWKRDMWYDQTGLVWRSPSPNIPDLQVATAYPGMCLFEGTNISEGRGTYQPFLRIGAPWFDKDHFIAINKVIELPGVFLGPITFTPRSIPAMSPHPKYKDDLITGISLSVNNRNTFRPYLSGIMLVHHFYRLDSRSFKWRELHFDRLCGTSKVRKFIMERKGLDEIKEWMDKDIEHFRKIRKKYLLY
jgi:uncharacterized protein YbbC (DUF1343 family)